MPIVIFAVLFDGYFWLPYAVSCVVVGLCVGMMLLRVRD